MKDPITGEARRVDFVVVENGQVRELVEVTSTTANKSQQIAKENRIMLGGGTFVRDRATGNLVNFSGLPIVQRALP